MKKFFCSLFSLCIIIFSTSLSTSASVTDETELANLVQNYLSTSASVKYEFEETDLEAGTVSEVEPFKLSAVWKEIEAAPLASADSLSKTTSVDLDIGNYLTQKAEYIKYTRMQENLNITNFSVTYGVPEVTIDGNFANVKIFETVGMRYDGLDEDSAISTDYDVNLVKTPDGWKIADVQSDDIFDKTHQRKTFSCETAIADYCAQQAAPAKVVQEQAVPNLDTLRAQAAASGATVYSYNHNSAAMYSNQYTTSTGANAKSYYNPNFEDYTGRGGDCMNFASQCMFAGFGGSDDEPINTTAIPMDHQGAGYYDYWYKDFGTWRGTLSFQAYCDKVNHNLGKPVPTENNLYVDMYTTGPGSAGIYNYANRLPGSVVFVYDGEDAYGHAMVIGKVTGSASSQIFVSAHTTDVKLQPLSQCCSGRSFRIVVPIAYYAYTNKPAIRITSQWQSNVPAGTTVTFNSSAQLLSGGTCYRMAMKIVPPSGKQEIWAEEKMNTNNYSAKLTLGEKGLYKITTYAHEKSNSPSNISNTITLRTY